MRIAVVSPVRPGSTSGNDVTAARWSDRFDELGHEVIMVGIPPGLESIGPDRSALIGRADALVVLHARRCATAAQWWRANRADHPMVVALGGTDLYIDMPAHAQTMATVRAADHIVVLQQCAMARLDRLVPGSATHTTVVHQSVQRPLPERNPVEGEFRVVVLAHLREVKDPLLSARAARLLPTDSAVTVHHAGAPHDESWRLAALHQVSVNPRYTWHSELSPAAALELLATADVLACTSLSEGGANVVTESIAMGVPVIGTKIDGNLGLLGNDYPGLVPPRDAGALANLMTSLENTRSSLEDLQRRIDLLAPLTHVVTEREAWRHVLECVT